MIERKPNHHAHPLGDAERHARAEQRAARVREHQRKGHEGHKHLGHARPDPEHPHPAFAYSEEKDQLAYEMIKCATLSEVWAEFWLQAAREQSHDPPGAPRDQLIHHYGMHGFLEERCAREQKRGRK